MLVRFTVGNFCSFDKNQTLSLIAGPTRKNSSRLYKTKDFKVLKFASLFGANASGKSNFIHAIHYMQIAVRAGLNIHFFEENKEAYYKLNPQNRNKESYFEFEICIDGIIYAYGFEMIISQRKITEEWLIKLNRDKNEIIFSRNTETGQHYFDNNYLDNDSRQRINIYMADYKNVKDRLFLSEIIYNKEELYKNNPSLLVLKKIYYWINSLNITYPNTEVSGYDSLSKKNIDELLMEVKRFKTGITDIKTLEVSKEQALEKAGNYFRKVIEDEIQRIMPSINTPDYLNKRETKGFSFKINGRLIFVTFKKREPVFTEISFEHFNVKGISFSLGEESDGTQRLLDLLSVLFAQRENTVFIIDEIDRSLHPQLTEHFVKTYLNIAKEKNIQLIITTHESHLLNLDLLRQDEIFFIETNQTGESVLYPFDRFKERFDKKIEKAYLDGRYGAVPGFDDIYPPLFND